MNEIAEALRARSRAMAPRYDALGLRAADEIDRLEKLVRQQTFIGGVATDPVPMLKRRGRPPKNRS